MIVCKDLTKSYGEQPVLRKLSFDFPDRGLFLLLGESGSGKTTFLNILSGMIPFDGGSVSIDGSESRSRVDGAALAERIDYITQDSYFADFLTVTDNLRLVRDEPGEIAALLEQYGLSQTAEQLPPTLSGGEKQRLAILRAVLGDKDILLLDEPTAALDGETKQKVFQLLSALKDQALILCATHDRQAIPCADQIITFYKDAHAECGGPQSAPQSKRQQKERRADVPAKTDPEVFLKQWFRSKSRSRRSTVLFCLFLTLAISVCSFADTPRRKLDATLSRLYRLNLASVICSGAGDPTPLLEDPAVAFAMLDYGRSCPDGNENLPPEVLVRPAPDYEMSLHILPSDPAVFPMADHVAFGSWFEAWDDMLLSPEMAEALSPGDPEALLGQRIPVKVYGLGTVRFRVAGLLSGFTAFEKQYLRKLDIDLPEGSRFETANASDWFYLSSGLTDKLAEDPSFRSGSSGQRCWRLFFRSYGEGKDFYSRWHSRLEPDSGVLLTDPGSFGDMDELFLFLFAVALPLALLMALFSTLFYLALRKLEFLQSARFVAVFEYAGYDRKQILSCLLGLNLRQLAGCLALSTGFALVLTAGGNLLNRKLCLVNFQLFTWNPWILVAFLGLVLALGRLALGRNFRKLRLQSWYEILSARRDLL